MPLFGLFNRSTNSTAARTSAAGSKAKKGGTSNVSGRYGASANAATNTTGSEFQFTQSYTLSTVAQNPTVNLNLGSDAIGFNIVVTVALTGNTSTTADQLTAFTIWQLLGPSGVDMVFQPTPDFYMFSQRFGPNHVKPTVVDLNGTTATTGYYAVYGINLPALAAPNHYSMIVGINPYTSIGTSTTGGTVTITMEAIAGDAQGVTSHSAFSSLPFTPAANGTNDLVPVAPVQDIDLTEMFISGMTSNIADVNFFSSTTLGVHILPTTLVQADNAVLPGTTMDTDKIYPLLALGVNLNLTGGTHFFAYWGSSPSSSIRLNFYWLQ